MRWTTMACLVLLVLPLIPVTTGGTVDTPEVTDNANDQKVANTVPITTQPPAGTTLGLNADLLAGWITEEGDHILATIKLQGTGKPTSSSTTTWTFHMEQGAGKYDASATQDMASANGGVPGSGGITPGGVATAAVAAGDSLIILTVPLANLGNPVAGSKLTNLYVTSAGKSGGAQTTITDRAPDTAAGTDYTFAGSTGTTGGRTHSFATLSGPAVDLTHTFLNATTATYTYNWTSPQANLTVTLGGQAINGTAVLLVRAANATLATLDLAAGNASRTIGGAAGPLQFVLNYTAFRGTLHLQVAGATGSVTTTTTSGTGAGTGTTGGPGSGTGTQSKSASSSSQGSPAPIWVALAGLGAVVGLLRRRLQQG